MSANTANYREQGGASWVVGSGGSLSVESGGTLTIDPGATVTGGMASNTIGSGETLSVESGGAINVESGGLLKFAGTDKAAVLAASVANQIAGTASGKKVHGAAYTVTSDDATANTVTIATGVTIAAKVVQILRSGVVVGSDAAISSSGANLTVGDGSTYDLTAGDVVNYFVFGT